VLYHLQLAVLRHSHAPPSLAGIVGCRCCDNASASHAATAGRSRWRPLAPCWRQRYSGVARVGHDVFFPCHATPDPPDATLQSWSTLEQLPPVHASANPEPGIRKRTRRQSSTTPSRGNTACRHVTGITMQVRPSGASSACIPDVGAWYDVGIPAAAPRARSLACEGGQWPGPARP
jgi:hypothetical protein